MEHVSLGPAIQSCMQSHQHHNTYDTIAS